MWERRERPESDSFQLLLLWYLLNSEVNKTDLASQEEILHNLKTSRFWIHLWGVGHHHSLASLVKKAEQLDTAAPLVSIGGGMTQGQSLSPTLETDRVAASLEHKLRTGNQVARGKPEHVTDKLLEEPATWRVKNSSGSCGRRAANNTVLGALLSAAWADSHGKYQRKIPVGFKVRGTSKGSILKYTRGALFLTRLALWTNSSTRA